MTTLFNRPAIKAEARNFIREDTRWGKMMLATVFVYLLGNGFRLILRLPNFYNGDYAETSWSSSSTILTILLLPFTVAIAGYYLNHIRGFNPEWKSLYKEGFDHYGKYLGTGFLVNLFVSLWSLLLIIPGIVMGIAYSQAKYVIHDNPRLKATEAIEISKRMTNGYKGDLFVLYLSFIGWYFLCGCTFGILCIYVIPYVETTCAMYYENLKRNAIEQRIISPEAFGFMQPPQSENPTAQQYPNNGAYGQPPQNNYTPYPYNNFNNAPQTPNMQPPANAYYTPNAQPNPVPPQNSYERAGVTPEDTFNPGEPEQEDSGSEDTTVL